MEVKLFLNCNGTRSARNECLEKNHIEKITINTVYRNRT